MSHVAEAAPATPALPVRTWTGLAPLVPWLPALAVVVATVGALLATDTPGLDILRYAAYVAFAVVAPGTLVFRALRRNPHTLVEDLAYGAVVGLVLEIGAWAAWSSVGAQRWLWTWPLAVFALFGLLPRLRRHWWVRGYTPVPAGFAWAVAGVGVAFLAYLYVVFLHVNAILPTTDGQLAYVDLPFQLSLAAEAKHHFPMHVPQVSEEPLHYHWFGFAHMGAASLISGVDLPVVFYRLDVPLVCLASVVALAVTGWRASGRAAVGAIAAALTYFVGELNFNRPEGWPFGTIATFIVWSSMSMNYSWLLLIPLVGVLASLVSGRAAGGAGPGVRAGQAVPWLGRRALWLVALLSIGVAGAKSSSMPVVVGALGLVAVVQLVRRRRVDALVLAAIGITVAAIGFADVFIYAFATHGTAVQPLWGMRRFFPADGGALTVALIAIAFVGNMLLRMAGIPVLLWRRGRRLDDTQVLLVGGMLAGLGLYLVLGHPGDANQYFYRAGWMFGAVASAWGWVLLADRARLGRTARWWLAAGSAALAVALVIAQLRYARPTPWQEPMDPLLPVLRWLGALAVFGVLGALWWSVLRSVRPTAHGRGGLVLLTAILLAGTPGLVMDAATARAHPNGGGYAPVVLPATRIDAARWLREHSQPSDVVATDAHCLYVTPDGLCDARSFWLSAYSERRVLIEGWLFAPRAAELIAQTHMGVYQPFWDADLLALNDEAFSQPSGPVLAQLREEHGVRWLVLDRAWHTEPVELSSLADKEFDNGTVAIYRLR